MVDYYVLTQNVPNPKPDRRVKYDRRKVPVWEEGTRFAVKVDELPNGLRVRHLHFCKNDRGDLTNEGFYESEDEFYMLIGCSRVAEETFAEWAANNYVEDHAVSILGKLVKTGHVTKDLLKALANAYNDGHYSD